MNMLEQGFILTEAFEMSRNTMAPKVPVYWVYPDVMRFAVIVMNSIG